MKKINIWSIWTILPVLLFSSCVTEVNEDQVKRTRYANYLFQESCTALEQAPIAITLGYFADLWLGAESQQERYEVEDTYFPLYKVRQYNDSLELRSIFSNNCSYMLITDGNRFNTLGASWTILLNDKEIAQVTNIEKEKWEYQQLDEEVSNEYLTISCGEMEESIAITFKMNGSGETQVIVDDDFVDVHFEIDEELELMSNSSLDNLVAMSQGQNLGLGFMDGKLILTELTTEEKNNPAVITFLTESDYAITYKGVTEQWSVSNYFNY